MSFSVMKVEGDNICMIFESDIVPSLLFDCFII